MYTILLQFRSRHVGLGKSRRRMLYLDYQRQMVMDNLSLSHNLIVSCL
jgi:hypothetical protein